MFYCAGWEREQNAGGEPLSSISLDLFIRLHYFFPPTLSLFLLLLSFKYSDWC